MAVELPQVHLVTIDNVAIEACLFALQRTRAQICPAHWTHFSPDYFGPDKGLDCVQRLMWHEVYKDSRTCSHILFIQYDGWVLNGSLWQDSWLQYDYIGAPWPWQAEGRNIGNGGFSLRSVRLMKFLAENAGEFPVETPEDLILGDKYRPCLEQLGFIWAPTSVAREFSFEREDWRPTFGFHGIFNIPKVLLREDWLTWKANANDYIRGKIEWQEVKDL